MELDQIVARHVPQGQETVPPADIVAIEVINRHCQPCSGFALAEHWYAATGLEDLLGVPDSAVTKDRLYRTLDHLLQAKENIGSAPTLWIKLRQSQSSAELVGGSFGSWSCQKRATRSSAGHD